MYNTFTVFLYLDSIGHLMLLPEDNQKSSILLHTKKKTSVCYSVVLCNYNYSNKLVEQLVNNVNFLFWIALDCAGVPCVGENLHAFSSNYPSS